MGAEQFGCTYFGKDAEEAYQKAVEEAYYDHGHAGYTGTIAEKAGYKVYPVPKGLTASGFHRLLEEMDEEGDIPAELQESSSLIRDAFKTYDNKWGPAVCIPIPDTELQVREKGLHAFIFCGWASS